ncbi:type VI secretion system Vgr family protein [Undibacterium sp.]|uniref:type VI secretion system Vgr family protein n=1 Tax=Undibacterium sp. TaxID=1914977 RepID=UPI00374CDC66
MTDLSQIVSGAIALAGGSLLSQHARLISMETAQGSALPDSLSVEAFTGREAVNELFLFDIDALSLSADVDLKQFIGEEITLRLLQADGSQRAWHGYCTQASWLGADGGMARYRLRLEPFLSFLRLRRDSYIFQDKDAHQIVTDLLADYPQANFQWDATQTLATRPICTQYRESDLDFFTRLLASEGLSWRFEHQQDGAEGTGSSSNTQEDDAAHAKHKLVIFDAQSALPCMPGGESLRFHGVRASDTADAINRFSARRQVQSNAVSLSSWDHRQVSATAAEQSSSLDNGELPALAVYDGASEQQYTDGESASRQSELMLRAMELNNKVFSGGGAVRELAAGYAFTLTQHDSYGPGGNEFITLSVDHAATNNLDAGMASLLESNGLERGTYRNTFTCLRKAVPVVPALSAIRRRPTALGAQIALVVGLDGAPVTTDRDHRIKLQFPWQRGNAPHAGGMTDTGSLADTTGNAPGNEKSGTWVRVAEALSGSNWGSSFTPRIGTEVLVDFIEADIDRPVVVAQLYNGTDLPPYSAGADSGANHGGTLSGMHSNNLDGDGHNQWVVDDTQNQLRMRLASSTAVSQLNMGYLITQSPLSASRGNYRGSGFELRTDAWSVVRAAEGLLLSTTMRAARGSTVASTQMDASESVAQLKGAKSLSDSLSQAATQQQALNSKDAGKAQSDFIAAIDPQQKGKHQGPVNGQDALKPAADGRAADSAQAVEKFAAPIVHIESPTAVNLASPASTVLFAGQHLHWTTQADTHWSAAYTASTVSGNATSLFTAAGGIQAIAANGPLSLQAHTDKLEILADKQISVISVNDHIEINANQKITLQAGQSSITLEGGNITFACPGEFTVKGAQHPFGGGNSKAASLGKLPDTRVKIFDEAFVLKDQETGVPLANHPYRIKRADGSYEHGVTDGDGHTHLVASTAAENLTIEIAQE